MYIVNSYVATDNTGVSLIFIHSLDLVTLIAVFCHDLLALAVDSVMTGSTKTTQILIVNITLNQLPV